MIKKHFDNNLVMSVEEETSLYQAINAGYVINCLMHEIIKEEIMIM